MMELQCSPDDVLAAYKEFGGLINCSRNIGINVALVACILHSEGMPIDNVLICDIEEEDWQLCVDQYDPKTTVQYLLFILRKSRRYKRTIIAMLRAYGLKDDEDLIKDAYIQGYSIEDIARHFDLDLVKVARVVSGLFATANKEEQAPSCFRLDPDVDAWLREIKNTSLEAVGEVINASLRAYMRRTRKETTN